MGELANCPKCGKLFVKSLKTICDVCYKEEEKMFDSVYHFIKKRENREATIPEINEGTGVPEDVIIRFIKEGRLRTAHLSNLSYPCEKCGTPIQKGRVCIVCSSELSKELKQHEKFQEKLKQNENQPTYLIDRSTKR